MRVTEVSRRPSLVCAVAGTLLAACAPGQVSPAAPPTDPQKIWRVAQSRQENVKQNDSNQTGNANGNHSESPAQLAFDNPLGTSRTISVQADADFSGAFSQSLGTNGRSCQTCHLASDGWTITPTSVQAAFDSSNGAGPLFRLNDGSTSPNADVSSIDSRRVSYSMLLSKGLIRVGLPMPAGAEFTLDQVEDPYHFASAAQLSLFRRPLPTTNLPFLSVVMWDGRETFSGQSVHFDLTDQSNTATGVHAQATDALTDSQRAEIVAFETSLFTAQDTDNDAGNLGARHAQGGPDVLSNQPFSIGINDPFGKGTFTRLGFTLYDGWADIKGGGINEARRAVARGQALFNTRVFSNHGFSDTCSTCHNSPNAGSHSVPLFINLGFADASRRTADLPLYTFRNIATHQVVQSTDPGRALVTGKWKDIGAFKPPVLRAVASRAPYFHNGSMRTLEDVVTFYNGHFSMGLTPAEQGDLVSFLRAL